MKDQIINKLTSEEVEWFVNEIGKQAWEMGFEMGMMYQYNRPIGSVPIPYSCVLKEHDKQG